MFRINSNARHLSFSHTERGGGNNVYPLGRGHEKFHSVPMGGRGSQNGSDPRFSSFYPTPSP